MAQESKNSEEADFIEYRQELSNIAIKNNLQIGFERPNPNNIYKYDIFVKDYDNNEWRESVSIGSLEFSELSNLWKEIEILMLTVIINRKKAGSNIPIGRIKMINGSSIKFPDIDSLDSGRGLTPLDY